MATMRALYEDHCFQCDEYRTCVCSMLNIFHVMPLDELTDLNSVQWIDTQFNYNLVKVHNDLLSFPDIKHAAIYIQDSLIAQGQLGLTLKSGITFEDMMMLYCHLMGNRLFKFNTYYDYVDKLYEVQTNFGDWDHEKNLFTPGNSKGWGHTLELAMFNCIRNSVFKQTFYEFVQDKRTYKAHSQFISLTETDDVNMEDVSC